MKCTIIYPFYEDYTFEIKRELTEEHLLIFRSEAKQSLNQMKNIHAPGVTESPHDKGSYDANIYSTGVPRSYKQNLKNYRAINMSHIYKLCYTQQSKYLTRLKNSTFHSTWKYI